MNIKFFFGVSVLIAFVAVQAYAADTALNPKANTIKENIKTPAITKKIVKPVTDTAQQGQDTEAENNTSETSYDLRINEDIHFGNDPESCALQWIVGVHNIGASATPEQSDLKLVAYVEHRNADGTTQIGPLSVEEIVPMPAYFARVYRGLVYRVFPEDDTCVFTLKDGETVLNTKTVTLPGSYSIALGDAVFAPDKFTVSIQNNGADGMQYATVLFQGLTDPQRLSAFYITSIQASCIPANDNTSVTIDAPAQDYVGYRVLVYRTGSTQILDQRDYLQ